MKIVRSLVAVLLGVMLCVIGYQFISIEAARQDRIKNAYTPESIVEDSKKFFQNNGEVVIPEQPSGKPTQPGDTALGAYRYSKLLQEKFPQLLTEEQIETLKNISQDPKQNKLVRVYAYAALKRAGIEDDAQTARVLVSELFSELPEVVGQENLSRYMDLAEVGLDINPYLERRPLGEFVVTENQERLVVTALAQTYLFSNEDEVKKMFPDVREKLDDWVFGEDALTIPDRYLLSSLAYVNINPLTYEQRQLMMEHDRSLKRCRKSPSYIAVEVNGLEVCSLMLTEVYYQRGI
ncbi:hypothetical protein ACN082_00830 [Rothia sp. CCM 9417]|uniref:hypothetical protein n=1 Tax=Rothia sp. CCM 9417 TaxID=3402657 RepID=UPI003AE5186E